MCDECRLAEFLLVNVVLPLPLEVKFCKQASLQSAFVAHPSFIPCLYIAVLHQHLSCNKILSWVTCVLVMCYTSQNPDTIDEDGQ